MSVISESEIDEGRQVLSALLCCQHLESCMACMGEFRRLGVTAATFDDRRQRMVFACAEKLLRQGTVCDVHTVSQELARSSNAEFGPKGVVDYFTWILDCPCPICNVGYYSGRLRAREICRATTAVMNEARNLLTSYSFENKSAAEEWLDNLTKKLISISGPANLLPDRSAAIGLSAKALESLISTGRDGQQGLLSGYRWIDGILDGFKPSTLNILAARPSVGKSALAINIAENIARTGRSVLFISLEMNKESLMRRLLTKIAKLDVEAIRRRHERQLVTKATTAEELARLDAAKKELENLPIFIEDDCPRDYAAVEMCIRRHVARTPEIALVVVDYLQLIRCHGYGAQDRANEIGGITSSFKELSKTLKLPFLVLSQLSRANESDSRPPQLSDLRGSGQIEQDADTVILLSREKLPVGADNDAPIPICVNLAKNRNGRVAQTTMGFVGKWTLYVEGQGFEQQQPEAVPPPDMQPYQGESCIFD